jgi:hypothetical protein
MCKYVNNLEEDITERIKDYEGKIVALEHYLT